MPATWPKTGGPFPYTVQFALSCHQWYAGRGSTQTDLFADFHVVDTLSKVQADSRTKIIAPDCPMNHD